MPSQDIEYESLAALRAEMRRLRDGPAPGSSPFDIARTRELELAFRIWPDQAAQVVESELQGFWPPDVLTALATLFVHVGAGNASCAHVEAAQQRARACVLRGCLLVAAGETGACGLPREVWLEVLAAHALLHAA